MYLSIQSFKEIYNLKLDLPNINKIFGFFPIFQIYNKEAHYIKITDFRSYLLMYFFTFIHLFIYLQKNSANI